MYHFQKPGDLKGTISNLDAFLHRDLNTNFSSKWSGLWTPSYKLLDYYAYKINGNWLNQENLMAVDYGEQISYYFETESLSIKEQITMPSSLPGMKSKLEIENKQEDVKAVQIGLELGADIREKSQDIGPENYDVDRNKKRIKISNGKELKISSSEELLNSGDSYIKEHFPGEEQRCLVPGETYIRIEISPGETRSVEFRFSSGDNSSHEITSVNNSLEGNLGRTFESSITSMENLVYDKKGLGIIAGHPWFQSYWARDTFWTLLGMIDAGYFEESQKILENYVQNGLPGKINLSGENENEGRIDTYPLYIIAADKLRRHYGITDIIQEGMDNAFEELQIDEGVVQHSPDGTWMDTLERSPAVDVQALWLRASEIMGEKTEKLEKGLRKFEENGHIKDHLKEDAPHTINPAIPLMFGYLDQKDYLTKINAEFSSRYGARTRSVIDPGYESSGYHTGSSWGLTTCWASAANFRNGKPKQGLNFLEKLSSFLDKGQPGALPEVVDSETGENLGCLEQAWSSGLLTHVIDTYLLGIKVTPEKIIINPCNSYTGKRLGKKIGESYLDIHMNEGEVEILNEPNLDRELVIE